MDNETLVTEVNDTVIITTDNPNFNVNNLHQSDTFEQASYNFEAKQRMFSKNLNDLEGNNTDLKITLKQINELAINPQNDLNKIQRINSIAKIYINKDDLIGKVYDAIENNVNTNININFKEVRGKNKKIQKEKAEELIKKFNRVNNIKTACRKCVSMCYIEGTYITYLRNKGKDFALEIYPLGICEISDMIYNGEPIVLMNINKLKGKLQKCGYKDKQGNNLITGLKTIEQEIKENYPKEVYEAYTQKSQYVVLNPERTGVLRINNLNGKYGLTPIFRTLDSQLKLEVLDNSDVKNAAIKAKKVLVQLLDHDILGEKKEKTKHFSELEYAHNNLLAAFKNEVVLLTAPGYVKDVKYVEPQAEMTDIKTINYYRNKILNALGISFLSNESKSSYVSVEINVKELLKTINKIAEQLEEILIKYYYVILKENKINLEFTPEINLVDSELLEYELKMKLVDVAFNKLGSSYRTAYEIIGIDYENEKIRREEENKEKLDEKIFYARENGFTKSSKNNKDNLNKNYDKTEENQNKDKDKQQEDKIIYKNK